MSRDEIIAMAREAGFALADTATDEALDRFRAFAALVAAREREACAQVAMEFRRGAGDPVCGDVATAIRARTRRDRHHPLPQLPGKQCPDPKATSPACGPKP